MKPIRATVLILAAGFSNIAFAQVTVNDPTQAQTTQQAQQTTQSLNNISASASANQAGKTQAALQKGSNLTNASIYNSQSQMDALDAETNAVVNASSATGTYTKSQWQNATTNNTNYVSTVENAADNISDYANQVTADMELFQAAYSAVTTVGTTASTTVMGTGNSQIGNTIQRWFEKTWDAYEAAEKKITEYKKSLSQVELVKNAGATLNAIKQTKQLTGMMGATIGSLHDMTQQWNKDRTTKSAYSAQMQTNLSNFLSWRNELNGFSGKSTTYQPIFNFYNNYMSNTQQLRDPSGNLNVAYAILNTTSDQEALQTLNYTHQQILNIQYTVMMQNDLEVREHIQAAIKAEKDAAVLTQKINFAIYGQGVKELSASIGNLFKQQSWDGNSNNQPVAPGVSLTQLMDSTQNVTASQLNVSSAYAEHEIMEEIDQVNKLIANASWHRNQANQKMQKLLHAQMNPATVTLYQMKKLVALQNQTIDKTMQRLQE